MSDRNLADLAATYLENAGNPRMKPLGGGFEVEDTQRADREAQIGLGFAILELASALRAMPAEPVLTLAQNLKAPEDAEGAIASMFAGMADRRKRTKKAQS